MKQIILIFGLLASSSAFAGIVRVEGVATGYYDVSDKSLSEFILSLEKAADENASSKCEVVQSRISEYKISQMPSYLDIKYKVEATYSCWYSDF